MSVIEKYLANATWRVKENASSGYSLGAMNGLIGSTETAKYWLDDIYPKHVGDAHKKSELHIHDLGMFSCYCNGWSLRQIITEGLGGVPNQVTSAPPKHLSTLVWQMANFLGLMSNESAGAQAFSSVDTYLAPYVREEKLSYSQVKQSMQSLVFNLNIPSRWAGMAPFTNVTFDWTVPEDMANHPCLLGDEVLDYTYSELQDEMDLINKAFLEVMLGGDAEGRSFAYPIPTYNVTKDFDWDSENTNLLFTMAGKYGTPYFQNFINSDLDPSAVRSMCPMRGDTKVLVRSAKGVSIRKISEVYSTYTSKGAKYETMTSEGWASAVPVATPVTDMFKITLSNGDEIELGKNHLQPTKDRGTVHADELNAGDWLPYEKYPYDGDNGNFLTGFAIGAWLGDGSVSDGGGITFSLDAGEKDDITESYIRELFLGLGYNVKTTHPKETLRSVRVSSGSYSVIERFCTGDNALNKGISNLVFSKSEEFRRGVLTGLMFTDGSRSKKRFYTSSSTLRDTVSYLSASLGIKHICNYVDTREGRLGTNPNYRVDLPERDSYGDFYCSDEDYNYHSIVSIEKIKPANGEKNLYCFEVDNSDHLFMLPTGMITHNCRLQLDKRELRKRGGGLFGADEFTGSIGVVTINLPNIGLQTNTEEEFKKELHRRMLLAKESLEIKREVIVEANEGGLYPYTARYLKMGWKNHFSTIGLCGMNEACLNLFGEDLTTEKGNQFGQEILGYMRETIIGFQEETGNLYNLEASPSESTAYRFAKNDVKNFGKDIAVQGEGEEIYYTNSSHLPVDSYTNIFEALRLQDPLQTLYTGGTVFHGFLGEEVDASQAKHLVKTAFTNFRLPYLSITPTFSVCPTHGYLTGEQPACDICGSETEIYSRITGYYRPMKNWNKGKTGEYKKRAGYDASSTI